MLPNLVVIGGMKCGTSSLHFYLSRHPEISMSKVKELNFFATNWDKGLSWYETHFPAPARVRGESSPNYTKYPAFSGVAERMHSVLPDAKLIYLVRDPIERIESHYVDSLSWGRETRDIDGALEEAADNHYVNCSKYSMQLEQYLRYYPLSSILVVTAEGLKENRRETLRRIFSFLGVDDRFDSAEYDQILNTAQERRMRNAMGRLLTRLSGGLDPSGLAVTQHSPALRPLVGAYVSLTSGTVARPRLGAERRRQLAAHLREDVEKLRTITGLALDGWSV